MRRADRHLVEKGRGARDQPRRPVRGAPASRPRTTAGAASRSCRAAPETAAARRPAAARHHPQHFAGRAVRPVRSIPYQGCEHGCIYCFARPSHAYWNLGAGPRLRDAHLPQAGARASCSLENSPRPATCASRSTSAPTPIPTSPPSASTARRERCSRCCSRIAIRSRSSPRARWCCATSTCSQRWPSGGLCSVAVSLTTLDDGLKRTLEPRAAAPRARLRVISELVAAGVPVTVLLAPMIPALNDHEIEALLDAAADAGATTRRVHAAAAAARARRAVRAVAGASITRSARTACSNLLREARGGRLNDPRFGHRMRGEGPYAQLLAARFAAACRRHGLNDGARAAPRLQPVPARSGGAAAGRPVRLRSRPAAVGRAEPLAYTRAGTVTGDSP